LIFYVLSGFNPIRMTRKSILFLFTTCLLAGQTVTAQKKWKKVTDELVFTNPPFKECHASTILEPRPGHYMISFFAGTEEGEPDVTIWTAEKSGTGKWSQPVSVADGVLNDSTRVPTWNPVLFQSTSGKTFLFYKVGPNPREWWGMVRTSMDSGKTWAAPVRLENNILGPIKNKPIQLADGTIISPSSTETGDDRWNVHMELSTDDGKTWELIPIDDRNPYKVIQPTVLKYTGDSLQILCRSNQNRIVEAWSEDHGRTWGNLTTIDVPNPNSGIDAVTLQDGTQLMIYNPTESGKEWYNGRAQLAVAISTDGKKWEQVMKLENGKKEEFSYPAVIQTSDGRVHITYTFDRKNMKHVVIEKMR